MAENLDKEIKDPLTPKRIGGNILNYLSKSMVALIPVMMAAAMFRTIAVVAGPGMLNLWAADSVEYNLFNNWLYNAGFYFMPILLGWSAARQLGCSQALGMMMGGVLIAPEMMNLVNAAAETGATVTSIYGIPAALNDYSASVLPMILCMPVLWQVEKFFKKIVPDMLSTVFVPDEDTRNGYSVRRAVTGSFFAAIRLGATPATSDRTTEMSTRPTPAATGTAARFATPATCSIIMFTGISSSTVTTMPSTPDTKPMMKVSAVKIRLTSRLLAPMERRMPISFVRSSTEI